MKVSRSLITRTQTLTKFSNGSSPIPAIPILSRPSAKLHPDVPQLPYSFTALGSFHPFQRLSLLAKISAKAFHISLSQAFHSPILAASACSNACPPPQTSPWGVPQKPQPSLSQEFHGRDDFNHCGRRVSYRVVPLGRHSQTSHTT